MCYIGLFKRIIPFVLTFAAGLFVASFFVSIAFPGANWRGNRRSKCQTMQQRLQAENDNLRERNRLLELQQERHNVRDWTPEAVLPLVPPVTEFDEPYHPPKRPKQLRRTDVLQ
jgi:hypothetical protein